MDDEDLTVVDKAQAYVDVLLPPLRLQHWTVRVSRRPAESEDATAECGLTPERAHASIYLARRWALYRNDKKQHALVHELLHLQVRDVDDVITELLPAGGYLPSSAYAQLRETHRIRSEQLVDRLADVLAPLLPTYGGPEHIVRMSLLLGDKAPPLPEWEREVLEAEARADGVAKLPGCGACVGGFRGDDAQGRPIPCRVCKPHLRLVPSAPGAGPSSGHGDHPDPPQAG